MRRYRKVLRVNDEQRKELERWVSSRTLPAGDVFRARLILALASGKSYGQIERELGTSRPTIARWRKRFQERGLAGLDPQHKGSQPRTATPEVQARIIRRTTRKPDDGSTHWSCRKMAAALGASKPADIIGLYRKPPQHAAVFCVDEKAAIQALDRLDPVLPLSPGRAERHGFEYYRHGTLSLYAALEVKTGKVHGMTAGRHTSQEFIA